MSTSKKTTIQAAQNSLIYVEPVNNKREKLPLLLTEKETQTNLKAMGFVIGEKIVNRLGFYLNAQEQKVAGKVAIDFNRKGFHHVNTYSKPYSIGFNQWFYDGAWTGNEPGWVKISFDKNYKPEDAIISIRVGGYGHIFGGGNFDVRFEKQVISVPHTAGYNNYQAHTIQILINKLNPRLKRTSPLGDILIEARGLGSWKFFDATYNPLFTLKP